MSPRSWLFVLALIAADGLLVWLEVRRARQPDPGVRPFLARIATRYRAL